MSVLTTFTLFRFSPGSRWWAFRQMATAGRRLRGVPGLRFAKLLGTARRFGGVSPDWGRYALLCTWDEEAAAEAFLARSSFMDLYRARAAGRHTSFLRTIRSQGAWDGREPFGGAGGGGAGEAGGPVVVLTRATLRLSRQLAFWRGAHAVDAEVAAAEGLRWAVPVGELPLLRSGTVSVWESAAHAERFARQPEHRAAMLAKREQGWYAEELFARFELVRDVVEEA